MHKTNQSVKETLTIDKKCTVTTEELQIFLSCGRDTAILIGNLAEARLEFGKRVLWSVEKVKEYVYKNAGVC